mgnify:CR=1 FL=1
MNIFRHSRGLKMPVENEMHYGEFKNAVGDAEPFYKSAIIIGLEDDIAVEKISECNRIVYEQYKLNGN